MRFRKFCARCLLGSILVLNQFEQESLAQEVKLCDPVTLLSQVDVSPLSDLNLGSDRRLLKILDDFDFDGKAMLLKEKINFQDGCSVEIDLTVLGIELFSIEKNLKTGQETEIKYPLLAPGFNGEITRLVFTGLMYEADDENILEGDRHTDTAKDMLADFIKGARELFPSRDPQSPTNFVCNSVIISAARDKVSFTKSFIARDVAGNSALKKTVQLNLILSGFIRCCCPISEKLLGLNEGACSVITTSRLMTENGLTSGRSFIPDTQMEKISSRRLLGQNLFNTLSDSVKTQISQNSEINFLVKKRFGTSDLNVHPLVSGFEVQMNEKRSFLNPLLSDLPMADLLTAEIKAFIFFKPAEFSIKGAIASGGARTSNLPTEKETFLFTVMGRRGIEGIGIVVRDINRIVTTTVLFFDDQASALILAEQPFDVSLGLFPAVAFDCGGIDR